MREEFQEGYCSHPDASELTCSERIIRAHTIQRHGGLAEIAENGHVMSVKAGIEDIFDNNGRIEPKLVGVRSASTFNGFCENHDTSMFRPVETGVTDLSAETVYLLTFRALAYELYTKRAALRSDPIQREMDFGKPFEIQAIIQTRLHFLKQGMIRGLADLELWKERYDLAYRQRDLSDFSFYAVEFDDILPVAACGAFHPEVDFEGNQLQIISRGETEFDHIAFNLTTLNGASVAAFGWMGGSGPTAAFVESYRRIPDTEKATAIIQLAFEHLENTYMRPSWWNSIPDDWRAFAIAKFKSGAGDPKMDRKTNALAVRPFSYTTAGIRSTFG